MKQLKAWKQSGFLRKLILTILLLGTLFYIYEQRSNFLIAKTYFSGQKVEYVDADSIKSVRRTILKNHESYTDYEHYAAKAHSQSMMELENNSRVEQSFTAAEPYVEQINLFIYSPQGYESSGTIRVSLEDADGNVLGSTELEISKVSNAAITKFSFTGKTESLNSNETATSIRASSSDYKYGIPVRQGQVYTVVIETENLENADDLALYIMDEQFSDEYETVVDGETQTGVHLFAGIVYRQFSWPIFLVFVAGIMLAVFIVWIPWDALSRRTNRRLEKHGRRLRVSYNTIVLWILFLLTPFYNFLLLMKISNMYVKQVISLFFSFSGLLNLMLIGVLWWLCYVILNRKRWAAVAITTICTIFGFVNFALLQFRDSPLLATDIANVGTAMQVTKTYQLEITKSALWAIMMYVIWICAILSLREGKGPRLPRRIAHLLIGVLWTAGAWNVMFNSSVIEDHNIRISSFKPRWNYKKNGYMLSFWVSVGMAYVEKPDGYSASKVEEITAEYTSDEAVQVEGATTDSPNILVIMNESYSDLAANGSFETNQPYMPFFYSLTENTIRGTAHSSVLGGTTADSEFEFLTGFSMMYLPFHSVPYTNLIKDSLPNLTYQLKAVGYTGNIAFHPGMANSYNRNNVYPLLGFDEHISVETMEDPEYIRAYVSDESDYAEVMRQYEAHLESDESDQPFYMFNVTIQNHGSYTLDNGVVDAGISITDDTLQYSQATNYLNLIKKSDEALEELVNYFSNVDEPTIIVLYGDHQPNVESGFYTALRQLNDETGLSGLIKSERKYRIPFMIWANYDIEEQTDVEISLNYLAAYMKQSLGMPMTGFDKYLMNLYQTLPVITDIAVMDKDGNYYAADDETPYDDLLLEYQQIQYNGLIDTGNRLDAFFNLAEASSGTDAEDQSEAEEPGEEQTDAENVNESESGSETVSE